MKYIKLFEEFTFPSQFAIDDLVTFKPMARHSELYMIDRKSRFGKVVNVKFTKAKVFYDILDDYLGVIFDMVDSAMVEPSSRPNNEKLPESLSNDKEDYTFSTGDQISTDNITRQALKAKDEEAFVNYFRLSIKALSKKDISSEDETYLKDFYKRSKEINK